MTDEAARHHPPIGLPGLLLVSAAVLAVASFQLWISSDNPPGFFRDEAAIAYNAHTIAETGRDEYGARFPLYFSSFLDYKSPIYVYGLAGVFLLTGPDREVARGLAAVSILAAILLLGWLAYRRTQHASVAVATVVLAGTSPWLFELGRVAFEAAMEPLFLCLVLLGVERASRLDRWRASTALPVAGALGGITYVYAGGRLLAPLLAASLIVVGPRARWTWILGVWVGFAVTQLPLLVYSKAHPGALSRRVDATTFVTDDMPPWEIAWRAAVNYAQDFQVWHYVFSGDIKPYAHTPGAGALLGASLVLSVLGLVLVLDRLRSDAFWRFAIAALAVSTVPAAFTVDRFHAVRLAPFAVMLAVVAIPALEWFRGSALRATWARALAGALVVAAALQFVFFVRNYTTNGPLRTGRFEAGVPRLVDRAWSNGGTVYVDFDDLEPLALARWYAVTKSVDQSRVVRLADGGIPPTGSIALGRTQECDYACTRLDEASGYWIARVDGPGD